VQSSTKQTPVIDSTIDTPSDAALPRLRRLPQIVTALVAATIATGLILRRRTPGALGTPLPPFLMRWSPDIRWPALIAVAVGAIAAAVIVWAVPRVRHPAAFATLVYATTLAVGLAVSAARLGTAGWDHVFDLGPHGSWEASREYLTALPALRDGIGHYIGHFQDLLPSLPTHTKGNPPGPLVAIKLLSLTTASRLALACMTVGSLVAPLTYLLGRSLGGERRGRIAAALAAFSPSVLIYGFTSVDFVFAAIAAAVAALLVSGRPAVRAAGCAAAGLAVFCSWVLLAIPAWAVVVCWIRRGPAAAARLAAGLVAGILGVTIALALLWGYDPIAIFRVAERTYGIGAAAQRPYWFWLFGSAAAWLVLLGAPIAWTALRSLQRGDAAAIGLAVVIVVSAIAGFTKAETERIWLPYVPLACAAAAAMPIRRLGPVMIALLAETIAIELLFGTVW
jgi:methylthioxylose transferase